MAPKRKKIPEHDKVPIGRDKIIGAKGGKKLVEKTVRNNVLLYLEKLTDEEANTTKGKEFQDKLSSAVAGALDPDVGPEAVVDLSSYDVEDMPLFGNKSAGELMAVLLSLLDDGGGKKIGEMKDKKESVEEALAYLQSLIPLTQAGQKGLSKELQILGEDESDDDEDDDGDDGDVDVDGDVKMVDPAAAAAAAVRAAEDDSMSRDAAWLYGILWTSCLQWMDTRLRQMRAYAISKLNTQALMPDSLEERARMFNIRVHGGDLRVDAIISQIKYGDIRHNDSAYDVFFQDVFKKMYYLSLDDGLWLAKYGYQFHRGVDWPRIIGIIDKFVSMSDRVAGAMWKKKKPANFDDVHTKRFKPFCAHVSSLINKAKLNKDWTSSAADRNTLGALHQDLINDCSTWKAKGDQVPQWNRMGRWQYVWGPASYLRGQATTVQPRTAGQGTAAMRLRPQVRIQYPK